MADTLTEQVTHEYSHLTVYTNQLQAGVDKLNDLAAEGWELVSSHSVDKTIGLNEVSLLIRRQIDPLPYPLDTDAGWYPDPSGRHQSRYWNGTAWTHVVADNGKQGRDAPTRLAPTPGLRYT